MYVGLATLYLLFLQPILANKESDDFSLHWVTNTTMEIQFPDNTTSTIELSQPDIPDPNTPCLYTGKLDKDVKSKVTVVGCKDSEETLVTISSTEIPGGFVDLTISDGVAHRLSVIKGQAQQKGLRTIKRRRRRSFTDISFSGIWGPWGKEANCPSGTFVYGYRLRIQDRHGGDETALNDIELYCRRPNSYTVIQKIWSSYQSWGGWTSDRFCSGSNNPVAGFYVRNEPNQGGGDDSALNTVLLVCRNDQMLIPHWGIWGNWSPRRMCPHGTAVSGFKTQVEPILYSGDDSAMNGIALKCTRYP